LPVRSKFHFSVGDTYDPNSTTYDGRKVMVKSGDSLQMKPAAA